MVRESFDPTLGSVKAVVVVFQEFSQVGRFLKKQALICQSYTAQCPKKPLKLPPREVWTEPKAWRLEKECPSLLADSHA